MRETSVPHGFDAYTGSTGSEQQVSVPADGSTDVTIHNEEWSVQVNITKIDSETHQPIAADAEFAVFEWDTVEQMYIPFGGYNQYTVVRNEDGSYSVANGSSYATGSPADRTLYYTQRNEGKFIIVETRAPEGYYGDWSDITQPGTAGQVEGKRAYAFTITKDNDGSVIDLSNEDYNADIGTADNGRSLLRTPEGNTVTVTLYDAPQDATRTYTTDSTGLANNEDSYSNPANAGRIHVTEKSLPLMRDIVQICEPGGRILDPFAGAGTTILAAVREGYEAVGIEKTAAYYKLGSDRVKFALAAGENAK